MRRRARVSPLLRAALLAAFSSRRPLSLRFELGAVADPIEQIVPDTES